MGRARQSSGVDHHARERSRDRLSAVEKRRNPEPFRSSTSHGYNRRDQNNERGYRGGHNHSGSSSRSNDMRNNSNDHLPHQSRSTHRRNSPVQNCRRSIGGSSRGSAGKFPSSSSPRKGFVDHRDRSGSQHSSRDYRNHPTNQCNRNSFRSPPNTMKDRGRNEDRSRGEGVASCSRRAYPSPASRSSRNNHVSPKSPSRVPQKSTPQERLRDNKKADDDKETSTHVNKRRKLGHENEGLAETSEKANTAPGRANTSDLVKSKNDTIDAGSSGGSSKGGKLTENKLLSDKRGMRDAENLKRNNFRSDRIDKNHSNSRKNISSARSTDTRNSISHSRRRPSPVPGQNCNRNFGARGGVRKFVPNPTKRLVSSPRKPYVDHRSQQSPCASRNIPQRNHQINHKTGSFSTGMKEGRREVDRKRGVVTNSSRGKLPMTVSAKARNKLSLQGSSRVRSKLPINVPGRRKLGMGAKSRNASGVKSSSTSSPKLTLEELHCDNNNADEYDELTKVDKWVRSAPDELYYVRQMDGHAAATERTQTLCEKFQTTLLTKSKSAREEAEDHGAVKMKALIEIENEQLIEQRKLKKMSKAKRKCCHGASACKKKSSKTQDSLSIENSSSPSSPLPDAVSTNASPVLLVQSESCDKPAKINQLEKQLDEMINVPDPQPQEDLQNVILEHGELIESDSGELQDNTELNVIISEEAGMPMEVDEGPSEMSSTLNNASPNSPELSLNEKRHSSEENKEEESMEEGELADSTDDEDQHCLTPAKPSKEPVVASANTDNKLLVSPSKLSNKLAVSDAKTDKKSLLSPSKSSKELVVSDTMTNKKLRASATEPNLNSSGDTDSKTKAVSPASASAAAVPSTYKAAPHCCKTKDENCLEKAKKPKQKVLKKKKSNSAKKTKGSSSDSENKEPSNHSDEDKSSSSSSDEDDDDSASSSSSDSEGGFSMTRSDTANRELERRKKHPRRLHAELWHNDPGLMNDGPVCRCSAKARRFGIRHGFYPGEEKIEPCDPFTNNKNKLYHYRITISPPKNFLISTPTVINHDGHEYIFEGFSIFSHYKLDLTLPPCKVIRFNIRYDVFVEEERFPESFCVKELHLFETYLFREILELVDLKFDWTEESGCSQFHLMPRFVRQLPDNGQEILSMSRVIIHLLKSDKELVKEEDLSKLYTVEQSEWQNFADRHKGTIVTKWGMKPCAIRVDQIDRDVSESGREVMDDDGIPFPLIVHFGIRPPQLSYAGNAGYQRAWRRYVKYRHLLSNMPKPSQEDKSKLLKKEMKLQAMRTASNMKRDVTVAISSKGFRTSGICCDLVQHAMLIPVLVAHLRFHKCLETLEKSMEYFFRNRYLLQLAMTHPSYRENFGTNPDHARNALTNCGIRQPEYGDRRIHYASTRKRGINTLINIMAKFGADQETESDITHNERLEFLGDAVVEFVTSIHLFHIFPDLEEGGLATYRAAIVQNQHLAVLAQVPTLGLDQFMLYAHGSDLCHDSELRHAMANCFEALMGALFLDGSIEAADRVFGNTLFGTDGVLLNLWTNYPKHPLQQEEPEGDRDWIKDYDVLKRLAEFEGNIGVEFRHIRLLARAFTDRSLGYNNLTRGSNQRLEFLGDTVLQLISSEYLYRHFPDHHEGHLSLLRSSLVNNRTQSLVCDDLGMFLYAMRGDPKSEMKTKDRADLLEAFLGALYIDKGLSFCIRFCQVCFFPRLSKSITKQEWNDPKSKLQQCCLTLRQMNGREPDIPMYKVTESLGPTNTRTYIVAVYFRGTRLATAQGHSIQEAEMNAAALAIESSAHLFPQLYHQKRIMDKTKVIN